MDRLLPKLLLLNLVLCLAPHAVHGRNAPTPAEVKQIISQTKNLTQTNTLTAARAAELHSLLQYLIDSHRDKEAHELLRVLCSSRFADAHDFFRLGRSYDDDAMGVTKEGRKYFEKALKLNPDYSEVYAQLAYSELVENNHDKALQYVKKALACKRVDPYAHLIHAEIYADRKQYKEALANIAIAEKTDMTNSAELYRVKGSILENLNRLPEAADAYRKGYEMKKQDWPIFQLVRVLDAQKKYAEAITEINKIIAVNPRDGEAFRTRAALKLKLKDNKGALADMDTTLKLEPTARTYKERANLHKLMGHPELAKKDLELAEELMSSPF